MNDRTALAVLATSLCAFCACTERPAKGNAAQASAFGARPASSVSSSAGTLATPVDPARLESAVAAIAKPRVSGSKQWQRVQNECSERFRAAGFNVERHAYATGVNVIGTKPGARASAEQVVVSAHYDHIPGCAGADDNASGVASVFEIARVLGSEKFRRTLVVACWDEEERHLLGSLAYAQRAHKRGQNIAAMLSLDGVGFTNHAPRSQRLPPGFSALFSEQAKLLEARDYAADFIAAVASPSAHVMLESLRRSAKSVGLPFVGLELSSLQSLFLRDVYRSDHASFWANDYPGILLTDTANFRNPAYHCGAAPDSPKSLDYTFLRRVTESAALAAAELLERP